MLAILPVIGVLLAGIGVALQTPTNATLARASGSVLLAALISFSVGTVVLLLLWALFDRTPPSAVRGVPAWAWFGGVYGAGFVSIFAFAGPRIGLAATITIAIATQLLAALVIDHFGLLGMNTQTVTPWKLAGVALVVAGVVLVRRG